MDGLNTGYAALLLEQYLDNPSAVPPEWRALFESAPAELLEAQPGLALLLKRNGGNGHTVVEVEAPPVVREVVVADDELVGGVAAAMSLLKALRMHGHLAAHLDPLGSEPPGDPAIESGRYRQPLSDDERAALLARLSRVEGMEQYLRRAFLGQKQFSIEGLDVMVTMLDEAIEETAAGGAHEVVIDMAHRGRLNVLAHVVGRPYEVILREFEGERTIDAVVSSEEGGTGDVKYHLGAT